MHTQTEVDNSEGEALLTAVKQNQTVSDIHTPRRLEKIPPYSKPHKYWKPLVLFLVSFNQN